MESGDVSTQTYSVEVDLETANVGRADWNHAEDPISPSSERCDALVQNQQVRKSLDDV